jgi:hypothetical protein
MTISDTAQDNFDGYYVKEVTAAPGTNSCWWSGSGVPQNPGVQGLLWNVGTVAGGRNTTTGDTIPSRGT